ncbi:MAG: FAD-dependent thymidylate synthase [archaeon]
MEAERAILEHFFTNSDKPVFALKNMPPAVQSYFYMGVSRFPEMRQRFVKMLREKGCLEGVAKAVEEGAKIERAIKPQNDFSAEKNAQIFFEFGHKSAAEGSSIFFVSEENPIFATEIQQDFYFPMTTMEFSTRYAKKFGIDRVYWDPALMKTEFASEAKGVISRNLQLYENGFDLLMQRLQQQREKGDLPEKVSVLDSLRFLIPMACHTSIVLGGNTRAVIEHFRKLLGQEDSFVQEYAKACIAEASRIMPEYFRDLKADQAAMEREKRLTAMAEQVFGKKFSAAKEDVKMFLDLPTEQLVLAQILYPYCNVTLEEVLNKVNDFSEREKEEILNAATVGRQNKANPTRAFETRPIVFEIESPWALWKDFKRNRMNLRFHQPMRGKSGYAIPELIKENPIEKDYRNAMEKTSELIEKVYQKHGGALSKTVAAQGNKKRYLLCMGARQLTVLAELRTGGEGDKGYRKIASKMIELAKEKNPRLFGHINDNFKKQ